jgi:hypothetical protein
MQRHASIAFANAGDENQARSELNDRTATVTQGSGCTQRFPHTLSSLHKMKRIAAVTSAAVLLIVVGVDVRAQNAAQDAIDRNLLLRQQQEQDLQNRLNDSARNATPGLSAQPPAGAGGSLNSPQLSAPQLPPPDLQSQQLYQSQQQRQLEQQSENRLLPPSVQEQQNQIQLQQFQREDQAQELQREIQRDSSRAVPGLH